MFNVGEVVFYGAQGICKIDGVETKQIGKISADYYILKPVFNESTAVFVPVNNEMLTSKMQSVLTKAQADELIENASSADIIEADCENQKREVYKSIISGGDRQMLVSLIKTIRTEDKKRSQNGKRLNINDEQILRKAENLLYNELAYVYGVEPENIKNTIKF